MEEGQKYKEGKFIVEKAKIMKVFFHTALVFHFRQIDPPAHKPSEEFCTQAGEWSSVKHQTLMQQAVLSCCSLFPASNHVCAYIYECILQEGGW